MRLGRGEANGYASSVVRPERWSRPASVSLVRVVAREPGSRPRLDGENHQVERGVKSLRGGSERTGRSNARVLQPRQRNNEGAEPLTSRRRPGPSGPDRDFGLTGSSGVWGAARRRTAKLHSRSSGSSVDVVQAAENGPRYHPAMGSDTAGQGTLQPEATMRSVAIVVIGELG